MLKLSPPTDRAILNLHVHSHPIHSSGASPAPTALLPDASTEFLQPGAPARLLWHMGHAGLLGNFVYFGFTAQ